MLLNILFFSLLVSCSSFCMNTPKRYVHKFMIFNNKKTINHECGDECNHECGDECNHECSDECNNVGKKKEDIFDKFERVSREGNRVMQEEYLKGIREYLKDLKKNRKD